MLKKIIKITVLMMAILSVFDSCDDCCAFQYSEGFMPLEVGNTWTYIDYDNISKMRWEVIEEFIENGITKYKIEKTFTGTFFDTTIYYYDDQKLYTTESFLPDWKEKDEEYILIDFSTAEEEYFEIGISDIRIYIGEKTRGKITMNFGQGENTARFPLVSLTFKTGSGITKFTQHSWFPISTFDLYEFEHGK